MGLAVQDNKRTEKVVQRDKNNKQNMVMAQVVEAEAAVIKEKTNIILAEAPVEIEVEVKGKF